MAAHLFTMRALQAVPVLLASLVAAATAPAHGTGHQRQGAKTAPVRRAHQGETHDTARSRTGDPFMCDRVAEQSKGSVVMRSHRIVRGDSLSGIAALYGTTVPALAAANGLRSDAVIRTGQELVIPQQDRPGGGNDWLKYAHSPPEPGVLTLTTYKAHYRGRVLEKGRLSADARSDISTLLGVKGSRPPVPDRLLRLLVRVSDTFGGRPIRVVSGYRTSSYFSDSRHKQSAAIDFSIYGVPNGVVRQYLLMFENVGVGYYPNSSFVHLDVRPCAMQWVDYAGPGEAPRLRPSSPRFANRPSVSDLDEIAEGVAAVLDRTKGPALEPVAAPEPDAEPPPLRHTAPQRATPSNDAPSREDADSNDPP
jgi:LysM repeat protein